MAYFGVPARANREAARFADTEEFPMFRRSCLATTLRNRYMSWRIEECHARCSLRPGTGAKLLRTGDPGPPTTIRPMIRMFLFAICLVLTTSVAEADVAFCYDVGASSYITKPATYRQWVDLIGNLSKYWFEMVELPPS